MDNDLISIISGCVGILAGAAIVYLFIRWSTR